ncbi:MAG: hypothetical protein ACLFSQ_11160 [Candidatus Zixiibacteriota bacterium]
MKKLLFILAFILMSMSLFGFSSLGRDFFFTYPANAQRDSFDPLDPPTFNGVLILTSSYPTTGTVSNSSGTFMTSFTIPADDVTTVVIDSTHWVAESEVIFDKGLRIQSDEDITAYFLSFDEPGATNDMALLFPNPSLGIEYIVMCWPDNIPTELTGIFEDERMYYLGPSMFAITAADDGTDITITPSADTDAGHTAGVPFSVTLDRYETYHVFACTPSPDGDTITVTAPGPLADLTGSHISSNKPISVFAGNMEAIVPDAIMAADHLVEQMPPLVSWGTEFCAFPVETRNDWEQDVLRILASEDGTTIDIEDDGGTTTITLNRGEQFNWDGPCEPGDYVPFVGSPPECTGPTLDSPTYIAADKPILVGQYIMGAEMTEGEPDFITGLPEYDDLLGDPAFMLVPPIEQYSSRYVFLTPTGYNNDFLSVAIPNGYTGSLTLDGAAPSYATTWFPIPGGTHQGARINVEPGSHIIEADTSFMLQMYAFDVNYASYATVAGQNLLRINAVLDIIKYCELTPSSAGATTEYRIVLRQTGGDPSLGIVVTDTLPTGFTYSGGSVSYDLFGSASRTGSLDPSDGDAILEFGTFNMAEGDSIVITFTANIDGSVGPDIYDNAVAAIDDEGNTTSNVGGTLGPEDDCEITACDMIEAEIVCPYPCGEYTSCEDQQMIFSLTDPSGTPIDTMRVWFTVDDGSGAPYVISEATHPTLTGFTCSGTEPCDIIEAIVSGILYPDGATVIISLDSAYTVDDCRTNW